MDLHKKFILTTTVLLLIVMGGFAWQDFEINKDQIHANQKEKVELLTEIINNGLVSIMCEGRGREFQKFLESLIAEDIAAIRIFSENGTILNSSIPGEVGNRVSEKDMSVYRTHENTSVVMKRSGREVYSRIVHIKNNWLCQKCHGGGDTLRGILDVELTTREEAQKITSAGRRIMNFSLLTLLVLSGTIGLLSRYMVKMPLAGIIESMKKVEGGDLKARVRVQRQDEIGLLASSLNKIITDLDRARDEIDRCIVDKNLHLEKMASIGELSAAVAHEIKNPLAGISGALQVLAEDFPENSPRKEIAHEILNEIGRLDMAVKGLLTYARPPELNLIPADINAIIERVIHMLNPEASRLNVKINFISDNISEIMIDPDQMEKALLSISNHCIQSMQGGGTLNITTHDKDETGEAVIAISDTGKGIPRENLKNVFKPFFSTKHSGTGLGLAISRNIVEAHKGKIEVENRIGSGCTFRITLRQKG